MPIRHTRQWHTTAALADTQAQVYQRPRMTDSCRSCARSVLQWAVLESAAVPLYQSLQMQEGHAAVGAL